LQPGDQARTKNEGLGQPRDVQFGRDDGNGHPPYYSVYFGLVIPPSRSCLILSYGCFPY
jgi:hypothetical protein